MAKAQAFQKTQVEAELVIKSSPQRHTAEYKWPVRAREEEKLNQSKTIEARVQRVLL